MNNLLPGFGISSLNYILFLSYPILVKIAQTFETYRMMISA
jgi:hypothetical protein